MRENVTCLIQEGGVGDGNIDGTPEVLGEFVGFIKIVVDILFKREDGKALVVFKQAGAWEGVGVLEGDEGGWATEECDGGSWSALRANAAR